MKNPVLILFPLILISVLGCSTMEFVPGSATPEQFEKDKAYCEMEGNKSVTTMAYGSVERNQAYDSVYNPCMRSKGYKEVETK
jgi:hypothetical protein